MLDENTNRLFIMRSKSHESHATHHHQCDGESSSFHKSGLNVNLIKQEGCMNKQFFKVCWNKKLKMSSSNSSKSRSIVINRQKGQSSSKPADNFAGFEQHNPGSSGLNFSDNSPLTIPNKKNLVFKKIDSVKVQEGYRRKALQAIDALKQSGKPDEV